MTTTKKYNRVFLGGTCNNDNWRDTVIKYFHDFGIDYFNPVVEDWTPECIEIENNEKENLCNIHLYCITSAMTGVYSIAELIESTFNKDKTIIFLVIEDGFTEGQLRSLKATSKIVQKHKPTSIISFFTRDNFNLGVLIGKSYLSQL